MSQVKKKVIRANRRELEASLSKALAELQDLESNLKSQIMQIEASNKILKKDREELSQLKTLLKYTLRKKVVPADEFLILKNSIDSFHERVVKQQQQLEISSSVIKSLRAKLEAGRQRADVILAHIKTMGKVIQWKK